MTLEEHVETHSKCTKCPLHAYARSKVLYDLTKPDCSEVDVLFVGEGPGEVEDVLGIPFMGPSGLFFRELLDEVGFTEYNLGFTNLVACRPQEFINSGNRLPLDSEVFACGSRLAELRTILRPSFTVACGRLVRSRIYYSHSIHHPSYILRSGGHVSIHYQSYRELLLELRLEVALARSS